MHAGKRHFGHWSSIGQRNLVNAKPPRGHPIMYCIIRVFVRLVPSCYLCVLGVREDWG